MKQTLNIKGMTCHNCVRHVREALEELPGLQVVDIDLKTGQAVIEAEQQVSTELLSEAIEEAGYTLVKAG
ncbi:MAG: heavy-metal-associated domain-containing protein [SAR324 cluster bacterium]|nr:heavy-metal-associated domain-containing protein [SAR324 cluster bacterium]MBF0349953.1 heavy-metal-associated domain-containing protein [SAR324 cluster bacterium]